MNASDKSKVIVKVTEERTGKEVNAEEIEMKVITPSKKSFTTDLKEEENHHQGELTLNEEGTYNIQATIKTDDNKKVVIPFTYDNESGNSSGSSSGTNRSGSSSGTIGSDRNSDATGGSSTGSDKTSGTSGSGSGSGSNTNKK